MATQNEITTILAVEAGHSITSVPRDRYDYSNLSDFACSCGHVFVASQMTRRLDPGINPPALPQVHRAREVAEALGATEGVQTPATAEQITGLPFGAIVLLTNGQLAKKTGISDAEPWITQGAARLADADIAGAVVLWTP